MRCYNCNRDYDGSASFCPYCGSPNYTKQQQIQNNNQQVNGVKLITPLCQATDTKTYSQIRKSKFKAFIFSFLQLVIYLLIPALNFLFLFYEEGVKAVSASDTKFYSEFSFFKVVVSLINGAGVYNQTAVSIVMGTAMMLLLFGSAFFWAASIIAKLTGKFKSETHDTAFVLSVINAVSISLFLPLSLKFSGMLELVVTKIANMMLNDLGKVSSPLSFVITGVTLLLLVADFVLASAEKKTRKEIKHEQKKQ